MDANEIVTMVTERVKDAANVNVVFGDAVETAGGVTIIPVASVKVSGGGGGGRGLARGRGQESSDTAGANGNGMGLGVQVMARPLGYIEIKGDSARFVPIADVTKIAVGGMLVTGLMLLTANRFMRFKIWKKRQKLAWHKLQHMKQQAAPFKH